MFKLFAAFIAVAVVALGGAVLLLVWISSMTPIHVTDESEVSGSPPTAEEWVAQGAVLLVVGEVQAVYGAEWSTDGASRPGTPWDVSGVPDDYWIHTPVLIDPSQDPVVLQDEPFDVFDRAEASGGILLALRGGRVGDDRYEVTDGQNREFESAQQVVLVLSVRDRDFEDPQLIETTFGPGWEFMARYQVEDGMAIMQWGDEQYEQPLEELVAAFESAAR